MGFLEAFSPMLRDYGFVSCDIVSHSSEANLEKQLQNVSAINKIVADFLQRPDSQGTIWASGGDGGHVAFPTDRSVLPALHLICAWRQWSRQAAVSLRITANCGAAESITGADGRIQLVGFGINLAGKLLPFGDQSRVILTEGFVRLLGADLKEPFVLHDKRTLQPRSLPDETVFLLSALEQFESVWDMPVSPLDRCLMQLALEKGEPFEVIYRAKRLLEINPEDALAKETLHLLAANKIRPKKESGFFFDLLLDEDFGLEIVRASTLVERHRGETICEYGEHGTTMFLILRGQVGVFFANNISSSTRQPLLPNVILPPGELAGELAFALRRPRTATLRCTEDSAFLAFNSTEFFDRVQSARIRPQLRDTLDRKLLSKIIEHVWNNAAFFRAGVAQSDDAFGKQAKPWSKLSANAEEIVVRRGTWIPGLAESGPDFEGFCFLVSGRAQQEGALEVLDGTHYPILWANFLGECVFNRSKCFAQEEVRLIKFGRDDLLNALDAEACNEMLERICQIVSGRGKKKAVERFDVLLAHNSKNKPEVRRLGELLRQRGLKVWLDEWELVPGRRWQEALEEVIETIDSVAVMIGEDGLGPWEQIEMRGCLTQSVERGLRVIPVLLPTAPKQPVLPIFLRDFHLVDLRGGLSEEGIALLEWGITNRKPAS